MKSKRIDEPKTKQKETYPVLMEHETEVFVVVFTSVISGMVVWSKTSTYHVGYSHHGWRPRDFKPFNGTIELSND